ncbi:PKD domain-containing protein [Lewinella sp. IMCC34183]|uniref:PKD domain-containing protein n=1 Tax=Lewinella sp. IMCC34183 TaxID=2248762 RepID=UPI000E226183|nr:PKD domain-containing protein [Lewinella sp. IMCC34183]
MKLTHFSFLILLAVLFGSCEDELLLPALDKAALPSDLSLDFQITGDNTGTVTVRPGGQAVTAFSVDFGDGGAASGNLAPGETITHVYDEGNYTVTLEAMNINGETTTYTEELTVSFLAPENLDVTVTPTAGNPLSIDVTATADLETNFLAYFGEDPDAEPTSFQEGETVSHEYGSTGTYELIVEARSGGAATMSDTIEVNITNPLYLPLTFEDASREYTFTNFGGATAGVVANPAPNDNNTSARVVKLNKQDGSEVWAGAFVEIGDPIDFSQAQRMSMKVWAPQVGTPVTLKLENAGDGAIFVDDTIYTSVANQWEEVIFDFSEDDLTREYSKVVVFFDIGNAGTGADYYFDDVMMADLGPQISLPITLESSDLIYNWEEFGGATFELIDNPDATGNNTSAKVGQVIKTEGAQTWGGVAISLPENIDFAASTQLSMKVWSPAVGIPVMLKVENGTDGQIFIEVTENTTVANAWETLTFTYSGAEADPDLMRAYSKIAVFFNFGNPGTGATYYFDDIAQVGVGGEAVNELPVGFESEEVDYALSAFGGAAVAIIDNPDVSGENMSARVGEFFKEEGSQTWAGAVTEFPTPIDFTTRQKLSMKVWSPAAGIPVMLKVENGSDGDIFIEMTENTTVANAWETLTFDYAGAEADPDLTRDYSKVGVFFNFGNAGTGTTYYFDDITQVP